ncbi:MAG: DUF6092 family protein [Caldiserica bacterium]|jgi:hypothetical protein|nr:DUF6092 family protein [Caldisericota bacterium]
MEIDKDFSSEVYELICYMVTSACNLIQETKDYGPFRLIDAVSRLVEILSKRNLSSLKMEELRDKIEENKYRVLEGESKFLSFLNDLVLFAVQGIDDHI